MKSLAVCVVDRRWLSYHVALTVLALSVPFVAPFVATTAQQASSRSAGKLTQWEVWLCPSHHGLSGKALPSDSGRSSRKTGPSCTAHTVLGVAGKGRAEFDKRDQG